MAAKKKRIGKTKFDPVVCDGCGERIESAYTEPDDSPGEP